MQNDRVQQQRVELEQEWETLHKQISAMRRQFILETRADEKFRLEQSIAAQEKELRRVEKALKALESGAAPEPEPASSNPPSAPVSRPSALTKIKKAALEKLLADLTKRYEAAYAQLMGELNAANKVPLQNQIDSLERQIQDTEAQLNRL